MKPEQKKKIQKLSFKLILLILFPILPALHLLAVLIDLLIFDRKLPQISQIKDDAKTIFNIILFERISTKWSST